jgi:hypothetical protein
MQFVSFTEQMLKSSSSKKEGDFALSTLMKSAGHFEAASSFQLDGYFFLSGQSHTHL